MRYVRTYSSKRGISSSRGHKEATQIQGKEHGLGAEHPLWDDLQNILIILFFIAVIADGVSQFYLSHSTVLVNAFSFPLLIIPGLLCIVTGIYLIKESHRTVFVKEERPRFVDSGVYSRVRHPMYLGMLLILLGILFFELSLIAFAIWIMFFIACDWMATYEEKDLVRVLGDKYVDYQKKVPKWFLRL
jgi:protein-S-isoprenylcysteine O-methyltransferase Ste14